MRSSIINWEAIIKGSNNLICPAELLGLRSHNDINVASTATIASVRHHGCVTTPRTGAMHA
eukprot:scaffold679584_cov94-Prasinocladus_malaysianus.AAC.1